MQEHAIARCNQVTVDIEHRFGTGGIVRWTPRAFDTASLLDPTAGEAVPSEGERREELGHVWLRTIAVIIVCSYICLSVLYYIIFVESVMHV